MEGNEIPRGVRKAATLPRTYSQPTRLPGALTLWGRGGRSLLTPLVKSKIHVDSFVPTQLDTSTGIPVGRIRGSTRGSERLEANGDAAETRLPEASSTTPKVIRLSRTLPAGEAPGTRMGTDGRKVSSISVKLKVNSCPTWSPLKENPIVSSVESEQGGPGMGCAVLPTERKQVPRSPALSNKKGQREVVETVVPTHHRLPYSAGPRHHFKDALQRLPLPTWSSTLKHHSGQCGASVQRGVECHPSMATADWASTQPPPDSEASACLALARIPPAAEETLPRKAGLGELWRRAAADPRRRPPDVDQDSNVKTSLGFAEPREEPVMSEQVPETRPKPAVAMKPTAGLNPNLLGYIGIDTIIEQMRKKTMRTGFDFNIMVVGQSGLGKSTLVNTLFKSQVSRKSSGWSREEKIPKTVEIKAISHVIEEGGVKMKLTVIDTPGFGDQINNENCWEPIEKFINEQYEKFLKEEVNIARKKRIPDTRVHCCLYFISPTGHSLRPLDLEFMKHLSKVVNIIPVIAKADTMTLEEKTEFKQRVRKELEMNGIEFYPQKEFDEDQEDKSENDKIRDSMPFAVVGSDKEFQVNGKRVLGRRTPWGIIEVENLAHCEFALLRDFVIRTHLQDLKEVTHNIHYETYRAKRLNDNGGLPPVSEDSHESNI
ncbi:neuronal-specific septin-3 isoform X2 [Pleurodeles waltl]|uniref:neuronal-specific septin-3 isoform X2 n=2 Tax=Pleurodeles waltl TaxID=8319 RepID=UPI00370994C0